MSEFMWSAPENSTPKNTDSSNANANISRIYVDPDIKSKIKLDDIYLVDNGSSYASNADMAGLAYPVICINNHTIKSEEINSLEIICDGLIPRIFLDITTTSNGLLYKDPPKDGDIISVFIRTSTDLIVPLRCDFIIKNNYSMEKFISLSPLNNKMILTGDLFIPGIYSEMTSYAKVGTSLDVLKSISKKLNIGFATNEMDNLSDKQLWICPKDSMKDFITNITSHCWMNEQSFYKSWIDIYYNLNFINVNKILMSDDDAVDVTAGTSINDIYRTFSVDTSQDNAKSTIKVFTNAFKELRNSPFFITEWSPFNQSSKITEKYGSRINTFEFFHNQNIYNSDDEPVVSLMNTQMYDPKKVDSYMLLRGRTNYDVTKVGNDDMARENIKTDDINTHSKWCGIQYVLSEDDTNSSDNKTWSGNVHKNYNRAEVHNLLNNKELDKMFITIKVAGACLQVMRGEKMPVILAYEPGLGMIETNNSTNINKLYSGTYIVDSYKITFKHNNDGFTGFNTEFTLKRREWPAPVDVQKD